MKKLRDKHENLPRAPLEDLTGKRFNYLLVLGLGNGLMTETYGRRVWVCACDCGGFRVTSTYKLTSGGVKSCGCRQYSFTTVKTLEKIMPVAKRPPKEKGPDALDYFFGRV